MVLVRRAPKWGGGEWGAAGLQPNPKLNVKNHRFCRHDGVKRFTWFRLQPKSATESASDWNIIILKNKMKNLGVLEEPKKPRRLDPAIQIR